MLIYTVEKLGFCNLLEKIHLQYDLPSSIYFSKIAIPALYEEMQQSLESDLKGVVSLQLICGAVSGPYLSYTVHYISTKWKLETKCLQNLYFPADHTAEDIAKTLQDTLEQWGV